MLIFGPCSILKDQGLNQYFACMLIYFHHLQIYVNIDHTLNLYKPSVFFVVYI